MTVDAWVTLGVLVALLVVLATERVSALSAMGAAVMVLLFARVITEDQAVGGLSNSAPVTIAALYVLAGAASATGALGSLTDRLVGGGRSRRAEIGRLAGSTAFMSAFVPNTPLVAMLAPRVVAWCRRTGRSPSAFLMPLSYAAVFGGVVTLMGTSTNLVVSDLLAANGDERLGLFEITPTGLAVAVVGVLAMVALVPFLLRDRAAVDESLLETARRFTVAMRVTAGGPLPGKTVAEGGLRNLQGVFLVAVERGGEIEQATPDLRLHSGDTLYFTGDVSRIIDLQAMQGLVSAEQPHLNGTVDGLDASLFEAVVSERSELAGATLRDVGFRARFGAAVLAIHRASEQVPGKLGSIPLRPGDVLLVLAHRDFSTTWRSGSDFSVIAALDEPPPPRPARAWLVSIVFLAMIALTATEVLSLLEASIAAAASMIVLRVISPREARRAVNLNVVLMMALSVPLGSAVASSGLAIEVAKFLGNVGDPFGDVGLLGAVLIATMILTEPLSNNGAAAVMFPIAVATALDAGLDPRAFVVAVLIGASCSFLTPIGYQTNMMVYGLGGYRFGDFARLGAPLTLITAATTLLVLPIAMPLR